MTNLKGDLFLPPVVSCEGIVNVPGSKSITNRVLLMAALARGETTINNILRSDDTNKMLDVLQLLGIEIDFHASNPNICLIRGCGGSFPNLSGDFHLGNAGTVLRPLTAVLALLGGSYTLTGVARMKERPVKDLVDSLSRLGANIKYLERKGFPPLEINEGKIISPKTISVKGDVSSQFLTSLMIALATLKKPVIVAVNGPLISRPYVSMTMKLLREFGVNINMHRDDRYEISSDSGYVSPGRFDVEGDASNASYFFAAAMVGGGPVRVNGISFDSLQGDIRFLNIIRDFGAKVTTGVNHVTVERVSRKLLPAFDFDLKDIPDVAMTLAVLALFCDGKCHLRNIGSWRVKETDRIEAMGRELRKFGALVQEKKDEITITPPDQLNVPNYVVVNTYDDHRMAMSLSLMVFAKISVQVNEARCVSKTFPNYFDEFKKLTYVPVITIDGPAGSGKGTVGRGVANKLGFNYLDSGILYRLVAYKALADGIGVDDEEKLFVLARRLKLVSSHGVVSIEGEEAYRDLRTQEITQFASKIAKSERLRGGLLALQQSFRVKPGLVADGRDMGTVVFPDAETKVYLTASLTQRADRRYKQLIEKGLDANLSAVLEEIRGRDLRDEKRDASPLQMANDSRLIDSTEKTPKQVINQIVEWFDGGKSAVCGDI